MSASKRNALLSVSDKTGLETLAKALVSQYHYTLYSTGGTKTFLESHGIPVIEVSELTGFEDMLDGRVKTLHPHVFGGVLADRSKGHHVEKVPVLFDTVVVNLYPFQQGLAELAEGQVNDSKMLPLIDIGGPSLLRASAKNYPYVNVLCQPMQYNGFLSEMEDGMGITTPAYRRRLARQAFAFCVSYDTAIFGYLAGVTAADKEAMQQSASKEASNETLTLSDTLALSLHKIEEMRYGENPHQQAALYGVGTTETPFETLHGKKISYNNIVDMEAAWHLIEEFVEYPTCAIIKHNNPCGVAQSLSSLKNAYQTALHADPLSAFGGIVAFNRTLDGETAALMKDVFLELIVAPDFEDEALSILMEKKNLRLVRHTASPAGTGMPLEFRQVSPSLFLAQQIDATKISPLEASMKVVSRAKPSVEQMRDLVFAWKVAKHVKSNAIVLAKDSKTVGIGIGQTSRIGALEIAVRQACDEATHAVMASDGFLPAVDNIHRAAESRIEAIIQPGGSIKDAEVIELANRYGIVMVTTGIREFRH